MVRFNLYGDTIRDLCAAPVISNKEHIKPDGYKGDPEYTIAGWEKGYSFKRFWGNCHTLLGDMGKLDGIQQLVHQYYLQNGDLGAKKTVERIKRLLGENSY